MGERTKFVRENAKKHGIIGEKMTETERKFYQNSSKSWLSVVRSMETRGKKQLLPSNGNLYHYAGNNPVTYVDPTGRESIYSIISKILEGAVPCRMGHGVTYIGDIKIKYNVFEYNLTQSSLDYIQSISNKACTHGAISFRNMWKNNKITSFESAETLKNSNLITYYCDSTGERITNPKNLYDHLKIGDVLIYKPDTNYLQKTGGNANNPGFTGHTATIIGKGKDSIGDYVITLEFHMQKSKEAWNKATVQRIYSETLRNFPDCELYGGASWN